MTTTISGTTGCSQVVDGSITQADLANTFNSLANYANDAAASAGGIVVGQLYRNGLVIMVRIA